MSSNLGETSHIYELKFFLTSCPTSGERLFREYTKFDFTVDEGKGRLTPSLEKNQSKHRRRKVEKFCVTFLLCDPDWCVHSLTSRKKGMTTHTHTHTQCVFFLLFQEIDPQNVPGSIRDCQPGTWSAGQEGIRGTSTKKLQREHENKNIAKTTKIKETKTKTQIPERRGIFSQNI